MLLLKSLAIVFTFQIWAAFGLHLGRIWASLGPHLGLTWASLGPHFAQFGPLLGQHWATIGAPLYTDNVRYVLKKNI